MIREKNILFICQLDESWVRIVKCPKAWKDLKRQPLVFHNEPVVPGEDDEILSAKIAAAFKKLGFNNNPLTISLPRNQATCRYSKIPSQDIGEIEKITNFYASRYLPYPAEELVSGYQVISYGKDGYSRVNQVVAHKGIIERHLRIFKNLKFRRINIILSSYGLVNLYNYFNSEESLPAVVINSDFSRVELAVIQNKKLIFSRSLKIPSGENIFGAVLGEEINKSVDAYLKETACLAPAKIVWLNTRGSSGEAEKAFNQSVSLPVEILDVNERIGIFEAGFSSFIGLGLKEPEESLSLLTQDIKNKVKESKRLNRRRVNLLLSAGVIFIWLVAFFKDLGNKKVYLSGIKTELNKISVEAKDLEELDKYFKFLEEKGKNKLSIADMLYQLNIALPADIFLTGLIYEENFRVVIRGQAGELNSVFVFTSQLEEMEPFKALSPKVRFATHKKTRDAEFIEFEILCVKNK